MSDEHFGTREEMIDRYEALQRSLSEEQQKATTLAKALLETDANAPWMSEAHMLCTDYGIAHGLLTDRIRALRRRLEETT